MATRYVDPPGTWATAQTGADNSGNEWQGPAGFQEALDTVGAGDIVFVKGGTCDLGRLVSMTVNDTTGWAAGDAVQNDNLAGGAPGDDWTGIIYEVTDGTNVIIETSTSHTIDDINTADGIDNVTQVDQETISAVSVDGLQVDGTTGTNSAQIIFTGTNGSWVNDGTKPILDGGSATTKATNCLYIDGPDYYRFENFQITDASGDGLSTNGAVTQDYWIVINCDFDNCGGDGADVEDMDRSLYIGCKFFSNTGNGCDTLGSLSNFIWCSFYNNTGNGIEKGTDDSQMFYGCIIHNNAGSYGAFLDAEIKIINCVIDGNTTGLRISSSIGGSIVLSNRITNNTTGANMSGPHPLGWNLFDTNGTDTSGANLIILEYKGDADTNEYDPDADDGYNDRANDDFNLKDSRTFTGETEFFDLGVGS